MRLGFVGLGKIGSAMALQLAKADVELAVYDVRAEAMEPLVAAGAYAAGSCAEVAERSNAVGIAVVDDAQVETVVHGPGGLLEGASPGDVIAVSSTVRVPTIERLAAVAAAKGVGLIDAGVAGGDAAASEGALLTTVGGSPTDVARAQPLLEIFSKQVIHAGPLGSGMRLKLLKNHMSYLSLAIVHEARVVSDALGIEPEALVHVVRESRLLDQFFYFGLTRDRSAPLERDAPERERTLAAEYAELGRKDLGALIELAEELGVEAPFAQLGRDEAGRYFLLPDDDGA